jgi:hypothetical protein
MGEGRQGHPDEGPLEGPDGLLAEWRVESSLWWSRVFGMLANSSLTYPQFITWSEVYQPQPPGDCGMQRNCCAQGSNAAAHQALLSTLLPLGSDWRRGIQERHSVQAPCSALLDSIYLCCI